MEVVNEMGVLVEFARQAEEAGFRILHVQIAFPDAIVERDNIEYRAELEYRAKNFLHHGHDPRVCDLIICWENDYPDSVLPVLALSEAGWQGTDLTLPSEQERELAYWMQRARRAEAQLRQLPSDEVRSDRSPNELKNELLNYLAEHPTASLNEMATRIGRGKTTAHNYVQELQEMGRLARAENGWVVTR